MRISKREFMSSATLGILIFSGCSLESDGGANLALTNSSGEKATIVVKITDRGNEDALLDESYQVPPSDDGILVEDVVMASGNYNVEATVENTEEYAANLWRIPSGDDPENYAIRVGLLSDGSLKISGDGI